MRRFRCHCGQPVFFDNLECLNCGRALGFDVAGMTQVAVGCSDGAEVETADGRRLRRCRNTLDYGTRACNWLLDDADDSSNGGYCRACRLNDMVPDLSRKRGRTLWMRFEAEKRRLLYTLLRLGLPFDDGVPHLRFRLLEDRRSNPEVSEEFVTTGHAGGVITLNAAEADPVFLEEQRRSIGERYRSMLGHLRHECGHYYFERLVAAGPLHERWRGHFGDERADYGAALKAFYAGDGPPRTDAHISDYARAHPHEDWAECWTHVLHMAGTLETATDLGLSTVSDDIDAFEDWLLEWPRVGVIINELNRSFGLEGTYSFTFTEAVRDKLRFVAEVIRGGSRG